MADIWYRYLAEKLSSGTFKVSQACVPYTFQSSSLDDKPDYIPPPRSTTVSKKNSSALALAEPKPDILFSWNFWSGWISLFSAQGVPTPVVWLPEDRRGLLFATHGTTVVVGGYEGSVTIIDMSTSIPAHADQDHAFYKISLA
jgi:hypothetical protein